MFEWKGPCSHGAHAPGHAHTSGSSSQQRPMGGRLFFCRLRHGLFLKMNSIYLRRINDSVFSVNSYITCIPLPVSTIWSIYNVFHLILFGDKWLVSEKRTDNNEVTWRPGAALQTAPSGGPRSGRGGPPRQDWELPCRQHPQGPPLTEGRPSQAGLGAALQTAPSGGPHLWVERPSQAGPGVGP